MSALFRIFVLTALLLTALSAQALAADFQAGLEAYNRGNFAVALREWRSLADQGDARAQFRLGYMYDKGSGVPQDHAEAMRWYRKAAEQGHAKAQYNLGVIQYHLGAQEPECVTREDVRREIMEMMGPIIESLVQETSAAIDKLKSEIDKLKK